MNDRVPYNFPYNSFPGRDEYYAWGLNQIAKAVSFLNNDCKLVSTSNSICDQQNWSTPVSFLYSLLFASLSDYLWSLQVHGNVCLASVVVTPTLDWKLHAFDVLSEFDGSNGNATGPMLVIQVSGSERLMEISCYSYSRFIFYYIPKFQNWTAFASRIDSEYFLRIALRSLFLVNWFTLMNKLVLQESFLVI